MGIVQRLDEDGNPIDIFGAQVNEPTINRFTAAVETQRVLDRKTRSDYFRSFQLRRRASVQSRESRRETDSGAGQQDPAVSHRCFVCERHARALRTRIVGDEVETMMTSRARRVRVCRYNQVDATRGGFLSVDYAVALRQLGGNISFNRFQATYRHYYKVCSAARHGAGRQHDAGSREPLQSARSRWQWSYRRDRSHVADQRAFFLRRFYDAARVQF